MTRVVFLREAEEEMLAAARYYNVESAGLGSEFLTEVERTAEALLQHPHAGPVIRKGIRRRLLARFPFGLLYQIDEDDIVILAVMHLRRRPGYWEQRL